MKTPRQRLNSEDFRLLALLRKGDLTRRRGGWRFGTKRIGAASIARLIACQRATVDGETVRLTQETAP